MLPRMEHNQRAAALLREIADLLEYQGVAFKPAAYRRAAQTVEDAPQSICAYPDEKALKALPGIGDAIAKKLREFCETGEMEFLQELRAETGESAAALMRIDDLGPKRVQQLAALGIHSVAELIAAAEKKQLQKLPRFSELLEKKILSNARNVTVRTQRHPLAEVKPLVRALLKKLRSVRGVQRCDAAGSYRRKKDTVGDVDILLAFDDTSTNDERSERVAKAVRTLSSISTLVAQGPTRLACNTKSGLRVDIRLVKLEEWGSAFLYFTGSKEHNISLRRLAIVQGMKLSEYGLFKGERVIASHEEDDIYAALGLPHIDPKQRTGDLPA